MRSAALVFAIASGLLAAYLLGNGAFDAAIALHPTTARAAPMLRILLAVLGEIIALAGGLALVRAHLAGLLLLIAAVVWAGLTWLLQHFSAPLLYGPAALALVAALFGFIVRAPRHVVVETAAPLPETEFRSEPAIVAAAAPVTVLEVPSSTHLVGPTVVERPAATVVPLELAEPPATAPAMPEGPAFTESGAEAWVEEDHTPVADEEPSALASFGLAFSNVVTFLLYGLLAAAVFAFVLAPPTRSMLRRSLPPGATSAPTPVIEPTSSLSQSPATSLDSEPDLTTPSDASDASSADLDFSLPDLPSASAASEPPVVTDPAEFSAQPSALSSAAAPSEAAEPLASAPDDTFEQPSFNSALVAPDPVQPPASIAAGL